MTPVLEEVEAMQWWIVRDDSQVWLSCDDCKRVEDDVESDGPFPDDQAAEVAATSGDNADLERAYEFDCEHTD